MDARQGRSLRSSAELGSGKSLEDGTPPRAALRFRKALQFKEIGMRRERCPLRVSPPRSAFAGPRGRRILTLPRSVLSPMPFRPARTYVLYRANSSEKTDHGISRHAIVLPGPAAPPRRFMPGRGRRLELLDAAAAGRRSRRSDRSRPARDRQRPLSSSPAIPRPSRTKRRRRSARSRPGSASQGRQGPLPPAYYLAISGGADDGAFGAGLLTGWTAAGTRPDFKVVTGVSTGALAAPFAFLGPDYDPMLEKVYTTISAARHLQEARHGRGVIGDGMADTAPLRRMVAHYVDRQLLDAIAARICQGPAAPGRDRRSRRARAGDLEHDRHRRQPGSAGARAVPPGPASPPPRSRGCSRR